MTRIPVSKQALDDMPVLDCMLYQPPPPSDAELAAGAQTYRHRDHEHTVLVGWRLEQERREWEAKREAEMAACPYVACECGHHEEP